MKNSSLKSIILALTLGCSGGKNIVHEDSTVIPQPSKFISVWLQDDWDKAIASLSKNAKYIESVSPAWYHVHTDGSLTSKIEQRVNDPELRSILTRERILLYPLLSNVWTSSQPDSIRPVLRDSGLRKKHIDEIISLVVKNNYDGVDVNYEGLSATDLGFMGELVDSLSLALDKEHKDLIVSLEIIGSSGMSAWQRIGRNADVINLLAYGKRRPRPSPLDQNWVKDGLERAVSVIPKEKIKQGLPLFGMYWTPTEQTTSTWEEITSFLRGMSPKRDLETLTPWFSIGADTVFMKMH